MCILQGLSSFSEEKDYKLLVCKGPNNSMMVDIVLPLEVVTGSSVVICGSSDLQSSGGRSLFICDSVPSISHHRPVRIEYEQRSRLLGLKKEMLVLTRGISESWMLSF